MSDGKQLIISLWMLTIFFFFLPVLHLFVNLIQYSLSNSKHLR